MCTFMQTLPAVSKTNGGNQHRNNIVLNLRPCKDEGGKKEWYRLRILAFSANDVSDRDYPFIERYVHQVFERSEKGFRQLVDEAVCLTTKYVKHIGNKYTDCPVCRMANQYFASYKGSNYRDSEAGRKYRELRRQYQAIVPVYVVNDPNYPANNGRFKVIIFNDVDTYKEFIQKVQAALRSGQQVLNGKNALDCCIHMAEVKTVSGEGTPNEKTYTSWKIDRIVFSTKPYDIPQITKEAIDKMEFDKTFYIESTVDELDRFFNAHYKMSNDDIMEDDITDVTTKNPTKKPRIQEVGHVPQAPQPKVNEPVSLSNPDAVDSDDINDMQGVSNDDVDLDDVLGDLDDTTEKPQDKKKSSGGVELTDDIDLDDVLSDLD